MAAMTDCHAARSRSGRCLARRSAVCWWSTHRGTGSFNQHSGGDYWRDRHTDVNAELHHADAARDLSGFLLLAVGVAVLTALDGE